MNTYDKAIYIHTDILDQMYGIYHHKEEVCGLISGKYIEDGEYKTIAKAEAFYPLPNIAPNKALLFVIDPVLQMKTYKDIFSKGNVVIGLYHTHPFNKGFPSETDRRKINDEYFWIIFGGQDLVHRTWWSCKEKKFLPARMVIE